MGQPDFDDAPLVPGLRAPPAASPLHKSPKADLTLAEEGELQHKPPNGPCQSARAAAAGCEDFTPSRPTSRPTETDV